MGRVVVPKVQITSDFEVVFTEEEVEMGSEYTRSLDTAFSGIKNKLQGIDVRLDTVHRDIANLAARLQALEHPNVVPELPSGCTFAEAMEGVARGEEWRRAAWVNNAIALTDGRVEWTHDSIRYITYAADIRATDWLRVK